MNPNELNALFDAFGIIGLLMACIPLLITIGLIIAIFQINSRVQELVKLQKIASAQLLQTAELQRQALIADLAAHGPNHQAYLDFLVGQETLTRDQADFILKQSGAPQKPITSEAA
jgi:hypothetical protein